MNVIYTHDIFSAQKYGGISRYFSELIKRIPPAEADIQVLAGLYVNEYIRGLPGIKGVKVHSLKHTGTIRMLISQMFQDIMLIKCHEDTIIHQTYYYRVFPNTDKRRRIVVTVYDMVPELFAQNPPAHNNISNLRKRCCERADEIIAISHSTKKDLVRLFGIDTKKISVIYLGSSLNENTSFSRDSIFPKPYILYVGKRGGYKNFDSLLQAFSQSNALRDNFHLICFGGDPFDDVEKKRFQTLGVSGLVHQVSGGDCLLVNYYKNASAFIYPSLYEGFGIPILEAMSLSCPVICSNSSSIPEVVGDTGVYFDPNDISSIQNALDETLFNKKLLLELKKRALERASIFSWDKCVSETLSVYRSLLS